MNVRDVLGPFGRTVGGKSADTRPVPQRLLAAAIELVQARGLQGLSQARVAAAAGLRQSHLTYYFPTRKDLVKAIVQAIHGGMIEALSASLPAGGHGAASVTQVREFFAERIRDPLMARLMLALMTAADEDPSLRRWLDGFDADLIRLLREVFGRLGLRPGEDELALLHASLVGAAVLGAQQDSKASADRATRVVRLAFDRLVDAARPAARPAQRAPRRTRIGR